MYNPFMPCIAQINKLGTLEIWIGDNIQQPKPIDDEDIAYIERSQERCDIFANCFDFTKGDEADLENGWPIVIYLHEDYVNDLFS